MGSTAFNLVWKKHEVPNWVSTEYKIYYQAENGPMIEKTPEIIDGNLTRAKIWDLQPSTLYKFLVIVQTDSDEGDR